MKGILTSLAKKGPSLQLQNSLNLKRRLNKFCTVVSEVGKPSSSKTICFVTTSNTLMHYYDHVINHRLITIQIEH